MSIENEETYQLNTEQETYFFPVNNEMGFRVLNTDNYVHLINTLVECTTELQQDYPGKNIMVVYEADSGMEDGTHTQ